MHHRMGSINPAPIPEMQAWHLWDPVIYGGGGGGHWGELDEVKAYDLLPWIRKQWARLLNKGQGCWGHIRRNDTSD